MKARQTLIKNTAKQAVSAMSVNHVQSLVCLKCILITASGPIMWGS